MKDKVVIWGDFFSIHFKLFGGIIVIGSYLTYIGDYSSILSIILGFTGLVMLLSRFGTTVNKRDKTIKKYLAVLFLIKIGKKEKYELLTCFWLKAHKMRAVWQNQAVSYVSPEYGVFDVYLVTSQGKNYYLFDDRSKQGVYKRLTKAMQALEIKCLDKKS